MDFENVPGERCRTQFDVVTRSMPQVALAGEQIFCLVGAVVRNLQLIQWQSHIAELGVMRIEIDDHQDEVGAVVGLLAVADKLVVVGKVKLERPVTLQCLIAITYAVDACDQLAQTVGPIEIPMADFVLFRIEIFLAAMAHRAMLQ